MSFLVITLFAVAFPAVDPAYAAEIETWRAEREKMLREDNGWLTLAGRFPLEPGDNSFGTGKGNAVVFPKELAGVGPDRLGTIVVDEQAKTATLKLAAGVTFTAGDKTFTGDRALGTNEAERDWVGLGRFRFHMLLREGKFILRLADNESTVRKNFPGRAWYPADEKFKIEAKFTPYPEGKTLRIINVLEQVSKPSSPGFVEFRLAGEMHKLDALDEGNGDLFLIFRDATAGDTTYGSARFLVVPKPPKDGGPVTLDFNKAYNPPCAFCAFTTCPIAPPQNILKPRIEAGEKVRPKP